jgi:antagonist of KipI
LSLLVEVPGLLTVLQDAGRPGYQHLGISPGGAMDPVSHQLASLLVGNPPALPSLEITLAGPTLVFEADALIALGGADLAPEVDGLPVPLWRPVLVRAGARMRFGRSREGCRCYLAVAGGFGIPRCLGGAGTHLAAGFGGFHGRALRAGDRLRTGPPPPQCYPALQRAFRQETRPIVGSGWFVPWFQQLDFRRPACLRLIPGPHWPALGPASRAGFLGEAFRVTSDSDRVGLRLRGPKLVLDPAPELVSAGVATGTLQLPPDGIPILLMADRPTTGGYPRLGELASVDLPQAGQLRPGEPLRFQLIALAEAQALRQARVQWLQGLAEMVRERMLR